VYARHEYQKEKTSQRAADGAAKRHRAKRGRPQGKGRTECCLGPLLNGADADEAPAFQSKERLGRGERRWGKGRD